jgi:hypothetical protein
VDAGDEGRADDARERAAARERDVAWRAREEPREQHLLHRVEQIRSRSEQDREV